MPSQEKGKKEEKKQTNYFIVCLRLASTVGWSSSLSTSKGGGARWRRVESHAEWQVVGEAVGEPLTDKIKVKHWPTVLSPIRRQHVAYGQAPSLLANLVPLTCPISVRFTFLGPVISEELSMCYWFGKLATVFHFSNTLCNTLTLLGAEAARLNISFLFPSQRDLESKWSSFLKNGPSITLNS